jgi:hypothetical protein
VVLRRHDRERGCFYNRNGGPCTTASFNLHYALPHQLRQCSGGLRFEAGTLELKEGKRRVVSSDEHASHCLEHPTPPHLPTMKKLAIISNILLLGLFALCAPLPLQAQGTLHFSSLGLTSTGNAPIGSDSWMGMDFATGTNAGGYSLNSVELALGNASGNPSGFTVMIYQGSDIPVGASLGRSIGTLDGSSAPVTAGVYAYSPASELILSPGTEYYVVATAGTAVAEGAYSWSYTDTQPTIYPGGWVEGSYFVSSKGGTYGNGMLRGDYAQFAIYATDLPVPEPSALGLLALGGFFLAWRSVLGRRRVG